MHSPSYGSYEDLVADPGIDGIHVATPHTSHISPTLLALRAGFKKLSRFIRTHGVGCPSKDHRVGRMYLRGGRKSDEREMRL
jgi:hypothetical protein